MSSTPELNFMINFCTEIISFWFRSNYYLHTFRYSFFMVRRKCAREILTWNLILHPLNTHALNSRNVRPRAVRFHFYAGAYILAPDTILQRSIRLIRRSNMKYGTFEFFFFPFDIAGKKKPRPTKGFAGRFRERLCAGGRDKIREISITAG